MPIFEFRCEDCHKRFSILVGMTAEKHDEKCPHCGSNQIHKLVSRFARVRSEDDRMDQIADKFEMMGDPDSPTQMRGMMKEMGKAMDEDASEEMEELFEADMAGELPDDE